MVILILAMKLRPYQIAGVNWMIDRYYHGDGCILGDEMGLGKTCQVPVILGLNFFSLQIIKIAYLFGYKTGISSL